MPLSAYKKYVAKHKLADVLTVAIVKKKSEAAGTMCNWVLSIVAMAAGEQEQA